VVEQNGQNLRMGHGSLYSGWVGVSQPGSVDAGWCGPCGLVGSVGYIYIQHMLVIQQNHFSTSL
jgi:hypothetical protein